MIIILSTLLLVCAAVIIFLIIVLIRQRRKRKTRLTAIPRILEQRAINNARDALLKKRPKSTNLEFLHATTDNKYNNAVLRAGDRDAFKPLVGSHTNEYIQC